MRWLVITALLCSVCACSNRNPDLKSPCVGAKDSPCDRRPVNEWWINARGGDMV